MPNAFARNVEIIAGVRAPLGDNPACLVSGNFAFIQSLDGVLSVNVPQRKVAWEAHLEEPRWDPKLTRRFRKALGYAPRFFKAAKLLTHLSGHFDGGFVLHALSAESGKTVWQAEEPLPPADAWTDPARGCDYVDSEELQVSFVNCDHAVVVAAYRTSRRCAIWTADGSFSPMPPFQSQLDLYEFDLRGGHLLRRTKCPDLRIRFGEVPHCEGLFATEKEIVEFDWASGTARTLQRFDQPLASFQAIGNRVYYAWFSRSKATVGSFARSRPNENVNWIIKSPAIRSATIHQFEGDGLLRLNETKLIPLAESGAPLHQLVVPPYFYGMASTTGVLVVRCDGHGANLFTFDRLSGELKWKASGHDRWLGLLRLIPSDRVVAIRSSGWIDLFETNGRHLEVMAFENRVLPLASIGEDILVAFQSATLEPGMLGVADLRNCGV